MCAVSRLIGSGSDESRVNRRSLLRTASAIAVATAGASATVTADDGVSTESCSCSCSCSWEYDCRTGCNGCSKGYYKRKVCDTDCGTVKGSWEVIDCCACPT
jgi:hypothetical protein